MTGSKERIDDLGRKGYRLIQNPDAFCFGMDAVLLAEFAVAGESEKVLDLCTGNGVVPILMAARDKGSSFTGIDIQEESVKLAGRSVMLNGLEEHFNIIHGDIKDLLSFTQRGGLINPRDSKAIARHEVLLKFEDVADAAALALKSRGRFYLVHRPRRIVDIMESLRRKRLEPKRMRTVHSFADKEANMILIEAVKDGGCQMIIEPPLVIYEKDGTYTSEVRNYYKDT